MPVDRSPWGPGAIAAAFALVAVVVLTGSAGGPGVALIVLLCGLAVAWYTRQAVLRYLERDAPPP